MFDNTTAAAAAPEPTEREPYIANPTFIHGLRGPAGWYTVLVEREPPLPRAYLFTIKKAGRDHDDILYRETFTTWRGQLFAGDTAYLSFQEMVGGAVRFISAGKSPHGWSLLARPLTLYELIDLDAEGELRPAGDEAEFDPLSKV
jgi:hypothetical protein